MLSEKIANVAYQTRNPKTVEQVRKEVEQSKNWMFERAFANAEIEFSLRMLDYDPFPLGTTAHIELLKSKNESYAQ